MKTEWKPVDFIVTIIVFIVFLAVLSTIVAPYLPHVLINGVDKWGIVSEVILALITIISIYVGSRIRKD